MIYLLPAAAHTALSAVLRSCCGYTVRTFVPSWLYIQTLCVTILAPLWPYTILYLEQTPILTVCMGFYTNKLRRYFLCVIYGIAQPRCILDDHVIVGALVGVLPLSACKCLTGWSSCAWVVHWYMLNAQFILWNYQLKLI